MTRFAPSFSVMKSAIAVTEPLVLHQLAEQGAEQEEREELGEETRPRCA